MKKIITGFLGLALVVSLVSGSAYAAFFDTVQVNGISINAGNADLKISDGVNFVDSRNMALDMNNVYPGYTNNWSFTLQNASLSSIALNVTGQLTSATGDWAALKDVITIEVKDHDNPANTTTAKTLAEWNAGAIAFPTNPLGAGLTKQYDVVLTVSAGAGSEIAGKSLTNITFDLVGTQP